MSLWELLRKMGWADPSASPVKRSPAMSLSDLQWEFLLCVAKLIRHADKTGYKLTGGDLYRDPRVFGEVGEQRGYGRASSVHKNRLAIDLNLFIDGEFRGDTEAHRPLGNYWKGLHDLAAWGGDFADPDGNHYSFKYQGRA